MASSPATRPVERSAAIDALRGAAFLAVFVFHSFLELNTGEGGWLGDFSSHRYAYLFPQHLGVLGVQLFFVISGFCIHRAGRGASWSEYARRRFARIYPLYFVVLLALFLLGRSDAPAELFVHATFLHTLVPGHINHLNPSFWSLAVEVQLYALYPLMTIAMRRWGSARTLVLCAVFALAWQLGLPSLTRTGWLVNMPFKWAFPWIVGVGVAELRDGRRWPSVRMATIAGAGVASTLFLSRSTALYAVAPPMFFAWLVGHAARRRGPAGAWSRLGTISYALYLVHQPILEFAATRLKAQGVRLVDPLPFVATSVAGFVGAIALAIPLEWLLESKRNDPGDGRDRVSRRGQDDARESLARRGAAGRRGGDRQRAR